MIHLAIATKLSTMFPNNDIKVNASGKTLSVNGTSLSLSGFKEGVLNNFNKFSPDVQKNVLDKVSEQIKPYLNIIVAPAPVVERVVKPLPSVKIVPVEEDEKPVEKVVEAPAAVEVPAVAQKEEESTVVADEKPKQKRKNAKK